jgi:three-Cys-motif partner protein
MTRHLGAVVRRDEGPARERRAAAAFKSGILSRYPAAFAARVDGWSAGRRAVFLDGYPGPGQYDDGSSGSPLLVAAQARGGGDRAVTGIFVEGDRRAFADLRTSLTPFRDFDYRLFAGDLSDHLPGILSLVPDSALFALLDPTATALDREQFTGQLLARGLAPTEVLVHLDVAVLARLGSALREASERYRVPDPAEALAVERLDRFLGGLWWHRDAMTVSAVDDLGRAGRVAVRLAGRFAQHVERQTGFRAVTMPVRLRPGHLPRTVFVLCARGLDGIWHVADALGTAGLDWYEAWRSEDVAGHGRFDEDCGQLALFPVEDEPLPPGLDAYRSRHEPQWVTAIERNIVRLLVEHGPFVLAERVVDVYGDTLGMAGSTHVRRAVRNLHDDGLLADDGGDERFHARHLRLAASVRATRDGDGSSAGTAQRPA